MILLSTHKLPQEIVNLYENHLFIPDNPQIEPRISFHTDLSVFAFDDFIICSEHLFEYISNNIQIISSHSSNICNIDVIKGSQSYSPFPNDVKYNAALVGNKLFCNVKYTEREILLQAKKRGIKIIHVNQGYAKCSTVIVTESSIITSDASIYKAAKSEGVEALFVGNDGVTLDGFSHGFIGGASITSQNEIIFTGNLEFSSYFNEISTFIDNRKRLIYFKNLPLNDYGSPLLLGASFL